MNRNLDEAPRNPGAILFLDFDGVLHPIGNRTGGAEDFRSLPLLIGLLEEFPTVRIVISSSWREVYDMELLLELLGAAGERVIGATPCIRADLAPMHWRHAEIMAWVRQEGYAGPWLALDDASQEFPDLCDELVLCDQSVGINEQVVAKLRHRLTKELGA